MNGKSRMFSTPAPFALSSSKGKRGVFQQPVRMQLMRPHNNRTHSDSLSISCQSPMTGLTKAPHNLQRPTSRVSRSALVVPCFPMKLTRSWRRQADQLSASSSGRSFASWRFKVSQPRNVATGPCEAGDKSARNWITRDAPEHDRDRAGCPLHSTNRSRRS